MNILILANKDIASNLALNCLLPRLHQHDVAVYLSSSVGGSAQRPHDLETLQFFEQSLFNELLFPMLSEPECGRQQQLLNFEALGRLIGQPMMEENAINSASSLARIESLQPDLIVSIRYGGILKPELIAVPVQGVINLHSGVLPAYRGVMATFWAMLNGDDEIGTTLHYISDASIDTGRIISTTFAAVDKTKSYLWHVLSLYPQGCERILETIKTIAASEAVPTTPQTGSGQYFTFPTVTSLNEFRAMGWKLFDAHEMLALTAQYHSPLYQQNNAHGENPS